MTWRSDTKRRASTTSRRSAANKNDSKLHILKTGTTDLGWKDFLLSHKSKAQKETVQQVNAKLQVVEQLLAELPKGRQQVRRQHQLRRTRDLLRRQLRSIYSDEAAMEIDNRIRPFAREHVQLEGGDSKETQAELLQECVRLVLDKAPSVQVVNEELCQYCKLPMKYDMQQAYMVCEQCGNSVRHIDVTSASTQYGDEVEFSTFLYRRSGHFASLMQETQAKCSTTAPMSVMVKIMDQLYKERVGLSELSTITTDKVKNIMKQLKMHNKYYRLSTQIASTLTGLSPPRMTPEQEQRLNIMFASIQLPFERHCPPDRKNFFSYKFCMYKCCELLGYTEFLPLYSLLKGRKKLDKQDEMWKKICEDLDWEYKRSVPQK